MSNQRTSTFDKYNPFTIKGSAPAYLAALMFDSLLTGSSDETASGYGLLAEDVTVAPRRVIPIHWDGLSGPAASAKANKDGEAGIAFIEERAKAAGIDFQRPTIGTKSDPFLSLP